MKKYVEFIQIQQQENHRNGVSCHFDVILATFDAVFLFVRSASSYGQNLSCLFQQIFRCLRQPRELFWSAYFCSQSAEERGSASAFSHITYFQVSMLTILIPSSYAFLLSQRNLISYFPSVISAQL